MAKQYTKTNEHGTKFYYKDPEMTILHRTDGPAVDVRDGDKTWYLNGKRHRLDGPAAEYKDEDKVWFVNGVFIFNTGENGQLIDRME
jgi:hypothetical protein